MISMADGINAIKALFQPGKKPEPSDVRNSAVSVFVELIQAKAAREQVRALLEKLENSLLDARVDVRCGGDPKKVIALESEQSKTAEQLRELDKKIEILEKTSQRVAQQGFSIIDQKNAEVYKAQIEKRQKAIDLFFHHTASAAIALNSAGQLGVIANSSEVETVGVSTLRNLSRALHAMSQGGIDPLNPSLNYPPVEFAKVIQSLFTPEVKGRHEEDARQFGIARSALDNHRREDWRGFMSRCEATARERLKSPELDFQPCENHGSFLVAHCSDRSCRSKRVTAIARRFDGVMRVQCQRCGAIFEYKKHTITDADRVRAKELLRSSKNAAILVIAEAVVNGNVSDPDLVTLRGYDGRSEHVPTVEGFAEIKD